MGEENQVSTMPPLKQVTVHMDIMNLDIEGLKATLLNIHGRFQWNTYFSFNRNALHYSTQFLVYHEYNYNLLLVILTKYNDYKYNLI